MRRTYTIDKFETVIVGRVIKTLRLRAEYYDVLENPVGFVDLLRATPIKANLFTFLQSPADPEPHFPFYHEWDSIAFLPITTFENWWTVQIKDKIRNMARRAAKKGVEIRVVPFDDELVKGIKGIYDESPVRQGRRFIHYGKDFETVKKDHITFLERSVFIGAYNGCDLIGFIKLVHSKGISNLMQIIAKMSERDKAPIDALLAKAVELCAQKGVTKLQYGSWSRRGLGDYKIHRGFSRLEVPRYYIPLDAVGAIALKCGLHRSLLDHIPENVADWFTDIRNHWYTKSYK